MLRLAGAVLLGSGLGAGIGAVSGMASAPANYLDRAVLSPDAAGMSEEDKQLVWEQALQSGSAWGAGTGALLGVLAGAAVGMEPERPPAMPVQVSPELKQAAMDLHQEGDGVWRRRP